MNVLIAVAAHRPYWMPEDPAYFPMQAGSDGKPTIDHWQRDDEGDHISEKNAFFCELTCLYWMWKNREADVYGLVHYRRYFGRFRLSTKQKWLLRYDQIHNAMKRTDVLLPKKRHYWIETNYSHYIHAHHEEELILTKQILSERQPDFLPAWDTVMARRSGHRFNMFIMEKNIFMAYCHWLFDVLFELEKRLDTSNYSTRDQRVFGYVGERLMDVWITATQTQYEEVPVVNLESQRWPLKAIQFLKRKWG